MKEVTNSLPNPRHFLGVLAGHLNVFNHLCLVQQLKAKKIFKNPFVFTVTALIKYQTLWVFFFFLVFFLSFHLGRFKTHFGIFCSTVNNANLKRARHVILM